MCSHPPGGCLMIGSATSPYAAWVRARRTSRTTVPAVSGRCGSSPALGEPDHRDDATDGDLDQEAEHPEKDDSCRCRGWVRAERYEGCGRCRLDEPNTAGRQRHECEQTLDGVRQQHGKWPDM